MENLTIQDLKKMLSAALTQVKLREDEFSKLDAVIGDGDHGTAIVQALTSVVEAAEKGTEFKTMLNDIGFNVMLQTSGSTSTLIGALFLGMSDAVQGDSLTVSQVKEMFKGGLSNVQKQTKAQVGDKTMMDALVPAVQAMEVCNTEDVRQLLECAAQAALKGAADTVNMKANFGRARNYGERSIGYADSGASSWACMFEAFANVLYNKI